MAEALMAVSGGQTLCERDLYVPAADERRGPFECGVDYLAERLAVESLDLAPP